ncbi:MAG: hypothetical protein ACE5PV_24455, partial [Candidatus Poribacteria bacterium]
WETYMENLRLADLVEFAVNDLSKSYPHLTAFLSDYPSDFWQLRTLNDESLLSCLKELDNNLSDVKADELYSLGANLLLNAEPKEINVVRLSGLPLDRNSRIVELPNGMGNPTLELLSLYPELTISQSCQILVSTDIAEALAGWATILCGATEDDNDRIVRISENEWRDFKRDTADFVLVADPPEWIKIDDIERKFAPAQVIKL